MIAAVIFDMDGVIVDTEQVWEAVREELVADWGGRSVPEAQQAMMGMSSSEWSRYRRRQAFSPNCTQSDVLVLVMNMGAPSPGRRSLQLAPDLDSHPAAGGRCTFQTK